MSSILILGGTAWLGAEVARQAVAHGHQVTAVARGEAAPVPEGVRHVRADRGSTDAYADVSHHDWDEVIDVTWQPGFARAAVAALGQRAAHWTYISSVSVYRDDATGTQGEESPVLDPWPGDAATVAEYGEAKVACETAVLAGLGDRALVVRPGLIGGPGDPSDRFGYWPAAFARAGHGAVLVPDARMQLVQLIDVRDLAAWLVGVAGAVGTVNAVGVSTPLGEVLDLAARCADHTGDVVGASEGLLLREGVQPWAGPRSLPLWLPAADAAEFGNASDTRADAAGLVRRPLADTMRDVLADEQMRGLDRERQAGLTRADELDLLGRLDS